MSEKKFKTETLSNTNFTKDHCYQKLKKDQFTGIRKCICVIVMAGILNLLSDFSGNILPLVSATNNFNMIRVTRSQTQTFAPLVNTAIIPSPTGEQFHLAHPYFATITQNPQASLTEYSKWLENFFLNYNKYYISDTNPSPPQNYINSSEWDSSVSDAISCDKELKELYGNDYQKNGIYWCDSNEGMPKEVFNVYQRRQGWVTLYFVGMFYMFFALAIVCDEYFVPSLEYIADKLNLVPDVAGATLMAAGGSAPELSTNIIGVFVAKSNVGIGTIVGSAVFNILFVLGACAFVVGWKKDVNTGQPMILNLSWFPLSRDCLFYILSLVALVLFFSTGPNYERVEWWESLILISIYIAYVTFMKYNSKVEKKIVKKFNKNKNKSKNKKNMYFSQLHVTSEQ